MMDLRRFYVKMYQKKWRAPHVIPLSFRHQTWPSFDEPLRIVGTRGSQKMAKFGKEGKENDYVKVGP